MASTTSTNFRVLKRTRRKPEQGDIFTFQLEPLPDRFYFGKVVATDTKIGGLDGVILIYIYRTHSSEKQNIPALPLADLLIPPNGINALPWTKGFFELVASGEGNSNEVLPIHCFRDFRGWHVDEYGRHLSGPIEPVGFNAMSSFRTLDEDICKALGI